MANEPKNRKTTPKGGALNPCRKEKSERPCGLKDKIMAELSGLSERTEKRTTMKKFKQGGERNRKWVGGDDEVVPGWVQRDLRM